MDLENEHVLGLVRSNGTVKIILLANFTEKVQTIPEKVLRIYVSNNSLYNLSTGHKFHLKKIELDPFEFAILETA
jgi:hypothetical protein